MILRPYQARAVAEVIHNLHNDPILVLPTGGGKTACAGAIVQALNKPTLFLAHRRELILQASASFRAVGIHAGVLMADYPADPRAPVQVASKDTLLRRPFIPRADLVIIDECHRAPGASYKAVLDRYKGVPRLGLTATPFRLDGKPLGDIFGTIVVGEHADNLVRAGVLVDPVVYVPESPDLRGIRIRGGDYAEDELARRVNQPRLVGNIVGQWLRRAAGRKTVVFAVNVEHSKAIVARFVEAGVPAVHLDADTPKGERERALAEWRAGRICVISNVNLFSEGFDLPALEVAILARPTASLCMHLQQIGRIARCCAGKVGAIVIDHAGNHLRLGRMTQRIRYSLADKAERVLNPKAPVEKTCDACGYLMRGRPAECPSCGAPVLREPTAPIEEAEGEMVMLGGQKARAPFAERREFWLALEAERAKSGLGRNFSVEAYRYRFGEPPVVVGGQLVDEANPNEEAMRAVFDKFAREVLEKRKKDGARFSPWYAAKRFEAIFRRKPPREWTQDLIEESKRREAADAPLFAGPSGSGPAAGRHYI